MEVTNLLDIHTREELYAWYLENHDKVSDFWMRVNRAREPYPGVYRRIKVDRIQHYNSTKRPEYAMHMLQTLIDDTRKGKMQPGWDDNGKLFNY